MAQRRISPRSLSVNQSTRKHIKERKRRKQLGLPDAEPQLSRRDIGVFWFVLLAALAGVAWFVVSRFD